VTSLRTETQLQSWKLTPVTSRLSLSNKVNNFEIRGSSGRISIQIPSCKYKPTTNTNDNENQGSSSGVMAAKDSCHVTLVQTAVSCFPADRQSDKQQISLVLSQQLIAPCTPAACKHSIS
jgi:hypothetical protein